MRKLDKSRPFGTIYPSYQGARYEQDGLYFNSQGKAIGEVAPQVVKPKPITDEELCADDGYDDEDLVEAPTVYHKPVERVTVVRAKASPKPARALSDAAPPLPPQVLAALHDDETPSGPDPDMVRGLKELPPAKWRSA